MWLLPSELLYIEFSVSKKRNCKSLKSSVCLRHDFMYVGFLVVKNDLDILRKDSLEIATLSTGSLSSPLTKTGIKFSSHPAISFASRFLRTAACSTVQR